MEIEYGDNSVGMMMFKDMEIVRILDLVRLLCDKVEMEEKE